MKNKTLLLTTIIAGGSLFLPSVAFSSQLSDLFDQITSSDTQDTAPTPPAEIPPENLDRTIGVLSGEPVIKQSMPEQKLLAEKKSDDTEKLTPETKTTADTITDNDLKTALEFVYSNNPQLKAKREELAATDEGVAQAVSGFRPDVSADLSKGRARSNNTSDTWDYRDTKTKTLSAEQPIFNGGGTIASFKAAKARVKAERANLSALEQQVLYNAVVAYTDVVEKKSVLELNQKNVDVLKKQLDATNARFKAGVLTVTDVAQAKARLAQAQADERQALGDYEITKVAFKRDIGYEATAKVVMPSVPKTIPESAQKANEIASENSPIIKAAHHNQKAAESNVWVRGASILPSVSLQGSASRVDGASNFINQVDSDSIKLNLHIPLYQSGAEWSRLREARNLAKQAEFNSIDTGEAVMENVSSAWEAFNTAKAIISSNEASVDAANTALDGVKKENEFGVRTVLDVLNAEQELFLAKVNLIKATRNEKIQAYRLLATIGKLTADDLKLKTEVKDPKEHYNSVKYQLIGL